MTHLFQPSSTGFHPYLKKKLKLKVNEEKSAVARPWKRMKYIFEVGDSMREKLR